MRDTDGRRAHKAAVKAAKAQQNKLDDAVKALLGAEVGREYLWWLLTICKVAQQPFSTDPLVTAFSCGELNIGQQVLAHIIEVHPEGYLSLMKEKQNGRRADPGNSTDDDSGADESGDDSADSGTGEG